MAQDVALSRRKQGFETPRERHGQTKRAASRRPALRADQAIGRHLLRQPAVGRDLDGGNLPVAVLTHGEAVPAGDPAYTLYLLLIGWVFFGWFWTRGGQTLGMRAWRIQVQTPAGHPIGWRAATFRYLAALFSWLFLGLGFLWQWVDHERLTWHDRLSRTRVVVLPKAGNTLPPLLRTD